MPGRKAQIATEYIIITSLILVVATMVFAYSYVSNSQNVRTNQANIAVERIINTADLVYALGPGNSQFVEVTFPQGLELVQDLTLCQGASGTYQNHYGEAEPSCPGDEVRAGAIEMRLSRLGGAIVIRSSSKAEIEMDVILPEEAVQPTMGKHIIKVYWCGEKICISSTERAVSEECLNGLTQDCPLKNADCLANPATCTCTNAVETCIGGVWPGCETGTYQDFNASYELVESSCTDKIDNDCDGLVDCFDTACQTNPICMCEEGETRLCTLQDGVCAGAEETCTDRQWPGCNATNYGALYQTWETSCSDNQDNDCDGITDCIDSDCVDNPACGYEEKAVIYVSTTSDQGNFGGKAAADAICQAEFPSNLPSNCTNVQAFLCDSTANVANMQSDNGGPYDSTEAIYWWHETNAEYNLLANDWADMLDGSILTSQNAGTGVDSSAWTGCQADGTTYSGYTCLDWTNKQSSNNGAFGGEHKSDVDWINLTGTSRACTQYKNIRCITKCSTELNCSNGEDDDGDGDTDCNDADCMASATCQANKTTVYIAYILHDGDFASEGNGDARTGADNWCNNNKPSNLSSACSNTKAFINVSGTDEIVDMRSDNGGPYTSGSPVYWWNNITERYNEFAGDWDDMLDATISQSQFDGTGINLDAWSGSHWNGGSSSTTNCLGWSTTSAGEFGTNGAGDSTETAWLIRGDRTCDQAQAVRCITECQTETLCANGLDDDADTLIDCNDPDCAISPACGITETKTTIYIVTTDHDGDFATEGGGNARTGADAFCTANQPANLSTGCGNTHAFIGVIDGTDEIASMPANYGYDSTEPIYWWHSINDTYTQFATSWADMLDETIEVDQITGTGTEDNSVWTGSTSDGTIVPQTENCTQWSINTGGETATIGGYNFTNESWMDSGIAICSILKKLRCITECQTEADCTNTVDDDSDGLTDCADSDCDSDPACIPLTGTKTTIYITTSTYTGNLGGRAGADNICQTEQPANMPSNCSSPRAFISVSATDEIIDMNSEAGGPYDATQPIYWWHSTNGNTTLMADDWADMLDGGILVDQVTGTGVAISTWTGSNRKGEILAESCAGWTTPGGGTRGWWGIYNSTTSSWMEGNNFGCQNTFTLKCITECPTEVNCSNGLDDDLDSLTDCDDDDCAEETVCLPSKTVIYLSNNLHDGALGGRAGADIICQAEKPNNLPASCTIEHAFLSVNVDDQLSDMATEYGYKINEPVYWWHNADKNIAKFANDWADMLDDSIEVKQGIGTGINMDAWSGSMADGTVSTTCAEWTDGRNSIDGEKGNYEYANYFWLEGGDYMECATAYPLRCIVNCQKESSCSDSINDNGDSTTDCADILCHGETGPNGETCENPKEESCEDGWDNDADGQTDCADTDCTIAPNCSPMLSKTTIFIRDIGGTGIMTNRAGADNRCSIHASGVNLPGTCTNIHAFLSVDAADEIRDMPTNYGYNSNMSVYWWNGNTETYTRMAKNWADMLDGSIEVEQEDATGVSISAWSGSTETGELAETCSAWTNNAESGTHGSQGAVTYAWLDWGAYACSSLRRTRCITECDTENNCYNGLDDDSDGLTDCADPDCDGLEGPIGEDCQPGRETNCFDGFDNDSDGRTDCDDGDCALYEDCNPMLLKTTVYTKNTRTGAMGGRAGADTYCESNQPTNLPASCTNFHAFLGVGSADEIRDMPANYGYEQDYPVFWWNNRDEHSIVLANNWQDMLDGTIEITQNNAVGTFSASWSGSNADGSTDIDCQGWTDGTATYSGITGSVSHTDSQWLDYASYTCNNSRYLRCMAECPAENHCYNSLDDDGDGLTDCYDPDCDGKMGPGWRECSILKTMIYITTSTHDGDFATEGGGDAKAGADAFCVANAPANLPTNCTKIRAFLSIDAGDRIRDLPYYSPWYRATKPLYWWNQTTEEYTKIQEMWQDTLNGGNTELFATQAEGTGISEYVWTGTDGAGQAEQTCITWSQTNIAYLGTRGSYSSKTDTWLDHIDVGCDTMYRIRCVAECDVEFYCADGLDVDADGLTDCADPDCDGQTGPNGETCEPDGETICDDGWDNDGDSLVDCGDDECMLTSECVAKTAVFIALGTSTGNLGGRAGADSYCSANKPANLSSACTNIRAFLSVDAADEIADMPTNYGYSSDNSVYWWNSENNKYTKFANDWVDMLDGTIQVKQSDGMGTGESMWTGGSFAGGTAYECVGWTNSTTNYTGRLTADTLTGFLNGTSRFCDTANFVGCIAECETEANCTNTEDDDGDGLTDCNDPDCPLIEPTCATCGNGALEAGEVCDSVQGAGELECSAAAGNYWGSYKEDGSTCSSQFACNSTCSACIDEATCEGPLLAKTLVYLTTASTNGDLASFGGGDPRRGADNFCTNPGQKPVNFPGSCGTIHAFLSVDAADEIVDLPGKYGYNVNEPVYWWHDSEVAYNQFASNWSDLLDGSISMSQVSGTGVGFSAWSGSNADGTVSIRNCNIWTTGSGGIYGSSGRNANTNAIWLYDGGTNCNGGFRVRCISRCQPETSCSDSINDNGDSKTDCADPFCDGQTGPNGESCEPGGETICDDDWDNDGDGQTDCGDIDCVEETYCTAMLTRTMIYMTTVIGTGVMTNRAGADSRCNTSAPGNLSGTCSKVHAFISVDAADEIQDMATNYGYNPDMPVYWWNSGTERYRRLAKNWANMLDSDIEATQTSGTGDSTGVWTGSNGDGSVKTTCSAWTNSAELATIGTAASTATAWQYTAETLCTNLRKTRCMAECDTENNCTNSTDDDSDGFTDCNDPDCKGDPACPCGNFVIDYGEECDDGANGDDTDACTDACTLTFCGDGIIQPLNGYGLNESCDVSLGGETCARQGCVLGGILSCFGDCSFDISSCNGCGPVAWYKFDEGSGETAIDSSGNNNTGTLYPASPNGPSRQAGCPSMQCLQFDGSDDYVEVPNDPTLQVTTDFTISMWIYRNTDSGGIERLLSKSDADSGYGIDRDFYLQVQDDDTIWVGSTGSTSGNLGGSITITPGSWYHVAATKDAAGYQIYINGNLDTSGISTGTIGDCRQSAMPLNIGRMGQAGTWYYGLDGLIDETELYDWVLDSAEILGLCNEHAAAVSVNCGSCFLAGTRVTMADGSLESIEEVEPGQLVLSHDQESNKNVASKVLKVYRHSVEEFQEYYMVINGMIEVTPNHRILVNGEWLRIGEAKPGDMLTKENGESLEITSIEKVFRAVPTYNLEIEKTGTYYANGILVHNVK